MPQIPYNPDANWEELHCHVRDHLREEVRLTRELLSNMHQEELSLMLCDHGTLNQVLVTQAELFERLSVLRLNRHTLTVRIEQMVVGNSRLPSVDEVLPPTETITTEILSLTDQLVSLTERMSRQYGQNQSLARTGGGLPHAPLKEEARPKRKAALATYHLNKYTNTT